jgi:hypothetical protein
MKTEWIRLMTCLSFAFSAAGCMEASYSDLKKELEATRYQYQLERLYVAGLKVQNRQLSERRHALHVQLESVPEHTAR